MTDRIVVRTFGNFDVFVDDKLVSFRMSRCKELLAYLVDRQGSSVTRAQAFSILWEDRVYDRGMQKQLDVVIRRLRDTLEEYGIEEIFEMERGTLRICPDKFTCDAYQFFKGDPDAINAYRGEYMSAYSWASMTESYMAMKEF
jgi:DNA-binding SARP family transcriptional activator